MSRRWMYATFLALLATAGCTDPDGVRPGPASAEARISAALGGSVALADRSVRLVVPAGSLAADTTIALEEVADLPRGDMNGMAPVGSAYRFTPAGTQFSLAEASGMTMRYDRQRVIAAGLDPRTVQLHYYDEASDRYVAVAGRLDEQADEVFGRVEHFTVYVPLARALLIGNNPPQVTLQATVPTVARAGAPLAIRATVKDIDAGGSVAGVNLTYVVAGQPSVKVAMQRDTTIGALDTFQYVLSGADVTSAATPDLSYSVEAIDNLGAVTNTATTDLDVVRTANLATLAVAPGTQVIAAGFARTFTWSMRDDLNASFTFIPDRVTVNGGIGEVTAIGTTGAVFLARTVGVGSVTGRAGNAMASAQVSVTNGQLDSIEILDSTGMPFTSVVDIKESYAYSFDAVGKDGFGNRVLINPTWTVDGNLGAINAAGVLDTLDGEDIGQVTARIGNVSTTLWVHIEPRNLRGAVELSSPTSPLLGFTKTVDGPRALGQWAGAPALAFRGPFVSGVAHGDAVANGDPPWRYDGSSFQAASMLRRAGNANTEWIAHVLAGSLVVAKSRGVGQNYGPQLLVADSGQIVVDLSLALAPDGAPWISYVTRDGSGVSRIFVKRWNGAAWLLQGATANRDRNRDALGATLAIDPAGTVYVASREELAITNERQAFVKRWTGVDWAPVGAGPVRTAGGSIENPLIEVSTGGTVYVALAESQRLDVLTWNGTAWIQRGVPFEVGNQTYISEASLALIGEVPYVAFARITNAAVTLTLGHPSRIGTGWMVRELGQPGFIDVTSPQMSVANIDGVPWVAYSLSDDALLHGSTIFTSKYD